MKHFSLVEETATFASGTFTMTGAKPGRITFASASTGGSQFHYFASSADGTQWEFARGQANSSGTTVSRVTVLKNSNGSTSSPVDFTGEVSIAIVAPASNIIAYDTEGIDSPETNGVEAMALGFDAEAWGDSAIALGFGARVGQDGSPVLKAIAIGDNTFARHDGAVCIGPNVFSHVAYALHGYRHIIWSGQASTSNATPTLVKGLDGDFTYLADGKRIALDATVIGLRSNGDVYSASVKVCFARVSGVMSIIGSPTVTEIGKTSGVTAVATAGFDTSGEFGILVTGVASQSWEWSATWQGVFI